MAIGCLPEQESMRLTAAAEGKRPSSYIKKHFEAYRCAPYSLRCKYRATLPFHSHVKAPCFLSSGNSKNQPTGKTHLQLTEVHMQQKVSQPPVADTTVGTSTECFVGQVGDQAPQCKLMIMPFFFHGTSSQSSVKGKFKKYSVYI